MMDIKDLGKHKIQLEKIAKPFQVELSFLSGTLLDIA